MQAYKNAWFARFARKSGIKDAALWNAVVRAEAGLVDVDLGGGVLKQRIAREGEGRSGGYRTLILFREGERAVFVFGFAKSNRANVTSRETAAFRKAAAIVLALTQMQIDLEVKAGRLEEVKRGDEEL